MEATTYMRDSSQVIVFDDHMTVDMAHKRDRIRGDLVVQDLIDGCPMHHRTHKYEHSEIIRSVLTLLEQHKTLCAQELLHELAKQYVLSERWLHMHVRQMLQDGLIASVGKTSKQKYYMTTDGYREFLLS